MKLFRRKKPSAPVGQTQEQILVAKVRAELERDFFMIKQRNAYYFVGGAVALLATLFFATYQQVIETGKLWVGNVTVAKIEEVARANGDSIAAERVRAEQARAAIDAALADLPELRPDLDETTARLDAFIRLKEIESKLPVLKTERDQILQRVEQTAGARFRNSKQQKKAVAAALKKHARFQELEALIAQLGAERKTVKAQV